MDAGIRYHAIMESVAKSGNPVIKINETPNFLDRRAAEYAWSQVSGILAAGASIVGVEMQLPESSVTRRGFADLVLRYDDTLVIVDWKLIRMEGSHDMQMRAYAIMAMEADAKIEGVRTLIIAPLIQHMEELSFPRTALDAERKIIVDLMKSVENPYTPGVPGDVCTGCKWSGCCPAQCKELAPISNEVSFPVSREDIMNPVDAMARARRRYMMDWLLSMEKPIKDNDAEWVKSDPVNNKIPGYTYVTKAGRSSLPAESVPQAIDKLVQSGYSLDAIHSACKLYVNQLAESLCVSTGESEGDLKKKLNGIIAEFQINGNPSEYLQRTSRRALSDLFKATLETKQLN